MIWCLQRTFFTKLSDKGKTEIFVKYEELCVNVDRFIIMFLLGAITGECPRIVRWESDNLFCWNERGKQSDF